MFGQTQAKRQLPDSPQRIQKSRIERVIFGSQRREVRGGAVERAQQLLSETILVVSAIETRLEKLLAIVERAGGDQEPSRVAEQAREFQAICAQIDELTALCSAHGSLIDSSSFALSIHVGHHGHSKITIPHVNLTSGPEGLALRDEAVALLQKRAHETALAVVQQAFQTLQRVQETYSATSRWLAAA